MAKEIALFDTDVCGSVSFNVHNKTDVLDNDINDQHSVTNIRYCGSCEYSEDIITALETALTFSCETEQFVFNQELLNFEWIPAGEQVSLVYSFDIQDDSGDINSNSSSSTVTIVITGTNQAPTASNIALVTTDEKTPLTIELADYIDDIDLNSTLTAVVTAATSNDISSLLSSIIVKGTDLEFNPQNTFQYLGVGESAQITVTYHVNDGMADSSFATIQILVNGLNDTPTIESSTTPSVALGNKVIISCQYTEPEGEEAVVIISDPDSNDVNHSFYQFKNYRAEGENWLEYWQTIPEQNTSTLVYNASGDLLGSLSFMGNSADNNLDRTKIIFSPNTTTSYLSSRTSDIIFMNFCISIKVVNDDLAGNMLFAEYNQNFTITGQHLNPVVETNSLILSSYGPSLDADTTLSVLLSPGYEVSTENNRGWQLDSTIFVENTEYNNEWFTIDSIHGIVSFINEDARNSFMNTVFTNTSESSLNVLLSVLVTDQMPGSMETGFSSMPTSVSLQITRHIIPLVTPLSIDITTATKPETANSLEFELESVFSFEKDPILTGHSIDNWYYFELLNLDTEISTIRLGNDTISLNDYSGFQDGLEVFTQSVMNEAVVAIRANTNTSIFHLNLTNHRLFTFLPEDGEIVLWFHARLNDIEYNNSNVELSFAVHITGVSEPPVVHSSNVALITTEDIADTNPTGFLANDGSIFYDNDSIGPFEIRDVAISGGMINYINYTNEELANWFGVTVEELSSCFIVTNGLNYEYNLSFQKEGKKIFQQIPENSCVNLNYSFKISDETGNVSETTGLGTVTIYGTDQQPCFSTVYDKSFTIDLRQENTGKKVVTLFQGEGGSLWDIDKGLEWDKQTFFIESVNISNELGTISPVNYIKTDFYSGKITINIDEVAKVYSRLREGESESLTYIFNAMDDRGLLIDQKSFTITIIGVNDAPVLSSFSHNIDLAVTHEMEIDWRSFVEDDEEESLYITKLNGQCIPRPDNMGNSEYDIQVYSSQGIMSGFIRITAVEVNGVLTHKMVYYATDNEGILLNSLQWGLGDDQILPITCSLQIADQYGLCSQDNSFDIIVTGSFDPLQLPIDSNTVLRVGTCTDSDYVIAEPVNITYHQDYMTFYEFDVAGITAPDGIAYTWQDGDVIISCDNYNQTIMVQVKREAMMRQSNPLVTSNDYYTINYSYYTMYGMGEEYVNGSFLLQIIGDTRGLSSTDISLDLTSTASQIIYEQTKNDSATVSLMNFTLSDPKGSNQSVTSYTVSDQSLALIGTNGVECFEMFNRIDGLIDSIEALAVIKNGIFTFTNTFTTYNVHNNNYNLSLFSFLRGAETIDGESFAADYLDLTFSYVITDYTVDGILYNVSSTGYITVRIIGENNAPIAEETLVCDPDDSQFWVFANGDQIINGDLLEFTPAWDFDGGRFDFHGYNEDIEDEFNNENGGNNENYGQCTYPADTDIDYSTFLIRNSQNVYVPFIDAVDKNHAITITDDILCWANMVENEDGEMELNGFCINTGTSYTSLTASQTATLYIYFKLSDYAGIQTTSDTSKISVVIHGNDISHSITANEEDSSGNEEDNTNHDSVPNSVSVINTCSPCITVDRRSFLEGQLLVLDIKVFYSEDESVSTWSINWGDNSDPTIVNCLSHRMTGAHYYDTLENVDSCNITLAIVDTKDNGSDFSFYLCTHNVIEKQVEESIWEEQDIAQIMPINNTINIMTDSWDDAARTDLTFEPVLESVLLLEQKSPSVLLNDETLLRSVKIDFKKDVSTRDLKYQHQPVVNAELNGSSLRSIALNSILEDEYDYLSCVGNMTSSNHKTHLKTTLENNIFAQDNLDDLFIKTGDTLNGKSPFSAKSMP